MFTTVNSLFPLSLLYSLNRSWLSSCSHWVNVPAWKSGTLGISDSQTQPKEHSVPHHAHCSPCIFIWAKVFPRQNKTWIFFLFLSCESADTILYLNGIMDFIFK